MEKEKINFSFRDKVGRNIKRQRESKSNFGYLNLPKDVKLLSLEDGVREIDLDFLPYMVTDEKHSDRDNEYGIAVPGTPWYRRPFRVHKEVGVEHDMVVCLRTVGKKCPICEYREKLQRDGADKEEVKALYPRSRSLYVVVPLGMKKYNEVPTVWDMSDYLFQDMLNDELEIDEENRIFPDLKQGKTMTLRFRWKKIGKNSFPETGSIHFNKRDPYPDSIMKEIPDVDKMLKIMTYEEMEQKFFALEDEDVDDDKLSDTNEVVVTRQRERDLTDDGATETKRRTRETDDKEDTRITRRREETNNDNVASNETTERTTRRKSTEETAKEPERVRERTTGKEETHSTKRKTEDENECPNGHVFGVDFEKFTDCEDCTKWNDCYDKMKKR